MNNKSKINSPLNKIPPYAILGNQSEPKGYIVNLTVLIIVVRSVHSRSINQLADDGNN